MDSISTTYLDEALADFSGYLAIDEVYTDPFCILSIVDNRRYNRLAFRVLDHDPTQDDVLAFLSEFKEELDRRGLSVFGITTDGSALYPKVLKKLWPRARRQICKFHVIKEIVKAVKAQGFKKVQVAIQGEELRVTAPSKDELQTVIAFLRSKDFGIELKFGNYRG